MEFGIIEQPRPYDLLLKVENSRPPPNRSNHSTTVIKPRLVIHRTADRPGRKGRPKQRPRPLNRFHYLVTIACSVGVLMVSCAPQRYDDPISVMLDREADFRFRRHAADQAQRQLSDNDRWAAALHQLAWDRGYPHWQRRYAIDELIRIDEQGFRRVASRRITQIHDEDTLKHLLQHAVQHKWVDFTPALIKSYTLQHSGVRSSPDDQRPERTALLQLHPGKTVERVVQDLLIQTGNRVEYPSQVAAWELLCRLMSHQAAQQWLRLAADISPLLTDLKAAADQLKLLPEDREGVLWLAFIRDPDRQDFWNKARRVVDQLNPSQQRGLELRHLPILVHLDPPTIREDLPALRRDVQRLMRAAEHCFIPTREGRANRSGLQRLDDWQSHLCWADWVTLRTFLLAMQDRSLVKALFHQAESDYRDTGSEYGGVLDRSAGRFLAQLYKPAIRRHDRKFYPPTRMIEHMYTALAHYHFHAQTYHNREYAGPGQGDLKMADRLHPNGLVLTFIGPDRLNVDYYQAGQVMIDLGTIRR